eukprot:scaffold8759_cov162-Amphora_coffeaeformis.AAC.1
MDATLVNVRAVVLGRALFLENVVDFFVCLTDKYLEMITKEPIEGHPGLRGQSGGQPRGGQPRDDQPGGRPRGGH